MKINFKTISRFLFLLLISCSAIAQQKDNRKIKKKYYDWGSIGMGFGVTDMRTDIKSNSFAATYNHSFGEQKIFLQGNIVGAMGGDIPSLFAINLAPGYAIGYHKTYLIALSIGPGYMTGYAENGFRYRALGGNATAQFHFKPFKDFGAGLELFFNIPFAGSFSSLPTYNGVRIVVAISQK